MYSSDQTRELQDLSKSIYQRLSQKGLQVKDLGPAPAGPEFS